MRDVLSLSSGPALPEHEIEIEIAAIDVADRLRLVDRDKVAMIAASISESYLHQAIAVASTPGAGNRYVLVDGEHRLEAHKLLGRSTVKAVIRDLTPAERAKHEIHANLIRNELDALDRTIFVGKLADIFEAENADARNGGDRRSKKWREKNQLANLANWSGFNKEAARRTGLAERSVRRARELPPRSPPRSSPSSGAPSSPTTKRSCRLSPRFPPSSSSRWPRPSRSSRSSTSPRPASAPASCRRAARCARRIGRWSSWRPCWRG
ncbi:ParB/RepB/Spo0J family partition protein [Bosea vaviloviae]|uniref:ParB-like N-terminal domain-containing protein n=1 Tax=Bosea vaviloviae TaxID=1526658 RepID=A0A0N1N3J6_9HYPH|nr:ParB/RepB/Spo0J family partition protein [Bosea vaviloviae]KPH80555.1 hypothetical protein AE618_12335 [Bosea vaviloviae]